VHHEGERLYDLARRGVCVDVPARPVEVHSLELLDFSAPRALLDVSCGPGTYVRALAHDLGEALGCGAALSFLVRLASGPFTVDEALLLDEVAPAALLPLEWPLGHLRGIFLDDKMMRLFVNGCRIASDKFEMEKGPQAPGVYKVYSPVKDLLGLGEMIPGRPLCLAPLKILSGRI